MANSKGIETEKSVEQYRAMEDLIRVVQDLSLARTLNKIMAIVRRVARELTGADGATFVLREGNMCFYADEDAIEPLWKGQRFPMSFCISGWVMQHRQPALIENLYDDPRIPTEVYQPTFVKSLVVVPIRAADPVGAIGAYWATHRQPTPQEVYLLQALANTTAVAMENVQVYAELEQRVRSRTAALQQALDEIKTLRGLVPICANCKKIRDDMGYWQHLEAYLQAHTEAEFTHGICPTCNDVLYGEYFLATE